MHYGIHHIVFCERSKIISLTYIGIFLNRTCLDKRPLLLQVQSVIPQRFLALGARNLVHDGGYRVVDFRV